MPAIARRHGLGNQEMEIRGFFSHYITNNPPAEYLPPDSTILNSAGLDILVFKWGLLQLWDMFFLLSENMKLLPGQLGLFMPQSQQVEKRIF